MDIDEDVLVKPRNEIITQSVTAPRESLETAVLAPEVYVTNGVDDLPDDLEGLLQLIDLGYESISSAQLSVLYYGSRVLVWARANEDEFAAYCVAHSIVGDTPETQVADILQKRDPKYVAEKPNRNQRREYGNAMGWFADPELCPFPREQAITEATHKGRIGGIAKLYAEKKQKLGAQARTAAATAAALMKRQEVQAAEKADMERVAREHAEKKKRDQAERNAALKAALVDETPLAVPLAPPPAEPEPALSEKPTVVMPTPPAGTTEDEPATKADPEPVEAEGASVADAEEEDEREPSSLPDIKEYLQRVPRNDRGWGLAAAMCRMIEQEGIQPEEGWKPPRAPIFMTLHTIDLADHATERRYLVIDPELCIDTLIKLFEERRLAAQIAAGETEPAPSPEPEQPTEGAGDLPGSATYGPRGVGKSSEGSGDDLAQVAARHRRQRQSA